MHITFRVARHHYEKILDELPTPSAIVISDNSITFSYSFQHRRFSGEQYMRMGLIRKSIESIFGAENITHIYRDDQNFTSEPYHIDGFYHKYCKYKRYPKWIWCINKADLLKNSSLYAIRLAEKGLFYFETILGYIYIQNSRLRHGKINKFDQLVIMAAKRVAYIEKQTALGRFIKLTPEQLAPIRKSAGEAGGEVSGRTRRSKASTRREKVKKMLDDGKSVPHIAHRLNASLSTIYNDIKVIR